jgi:hypothetical protein
MPQYFFSIRAGDDGPPAERAAELCDDAAALAYVRSFESSCKASPTLIGVRW